MCPIIRTAGLILLLMPLQAFPITLETFLETIKANHPVFRREALTPDIEQKRQDGMLGTTDWVVTADPSYTYDDSISPSFGAPTETESTVVDVGLERSFWSTGGRLGLGYSYENQQAELSGSTVPQSDGTFVNVGGPADYFSNALLLSYIQPLLKNRGGALDSMEYDIQGFRVEQSSLAARENQEIFLLEMALRFLEWRLLAEEQMIASQRLELARQDLDKTKERLDANLIDSVDYYRAEDAMISIEQTLRRIESQLYSVQIELSRQTGMDLTSGERPELNIESEINTPSDQEMLTALQSSRVLKQYDLQVNQLEREQEGLESARKSDLDLIVFGNLKDGDESFGESTGFDNPGAGVALAFRYPLANRKARSDMERNFLQIQQVNEDREVSRLKLESVALGLQSEITRLLPVLELNRKQMKTAAEKTAAELELYTQGRNQFTFVIQSQDSEARSKLSYVQLQIDLQRLHIQLQSVLDQLLR